MTYFGHSRLVHEAIYGTDARSTAETQEVNVREFLKISKQYQFFIGAIPALPDWLLKVSDTYFVGDGTHPMFRHLAYPPKFVAASPPERQVAVAPTAPHPSAPKFDPRSPPAITLYQSAQTFPLRLHQELFRQYSNTTTGLVTWKLAEQARAAEAIYRNNVSPLLVVLPCAAGKTTAALLAVAAGNGITIIIEPFISTCEDVNRRAREMGLSSYYSTLGQPRLTSFPIEAPGVIITTPEGATSKLFIQEVTKLHLARRLDRIIIDEIHQPLIDEGYRDTTKISLMTNFNLPVVTMTATMPPLMVPSLNGFLNFPSFAEIRAPTNIKNLTYRVFVGKARQEIEEVLRMWKAHSLRGSNFLENKIIVFCRSKAKAEELAKLFSSPHYTGPMDAEERKENLDTWREKGGILFATTALGPGVDTRGVWAVFGIDVPWTLVEFV
ncbi:hypothetical protein TWF481_002670 [Arthrobotrys musiformis]|uniref:DNA 3'-5' helicase n=1 Tax=Arthrobotrys musiformis TaxID=47236 RepID=A0AAV9VTS9_9PEZI